MAATTRQKTRVIVRVDSHNRGPADSSGQMIDLSADCIAFHTNKTTKATGRFQLQLVPRRNYSNLLFPNDVVNIYVDPGDGERGFIRLMMGYIDRVEIQETTDERGAVTTRYTVIGSDFQKAIDKTGLYFNGYMRQLLDERFVRTASGIGRPTGGNFNGIALRNAGLTMYGSPSDFVENMLRVLLGFNQQWQLPDSYARVKSDLSQLRKRKVQKAKSRLPTQLRDAIASLQFDPEQLETQIDEVIEKANQLVNQDADGLTFQEMEEQRGNALALRSSADLLAFQALVRAEQDPTLPIGIHDLLNTDFIEAMAIDGMHISNSIVQTMNATLAQFIYGHCNEIVNELIFDLRPVSVGGGLAPGPYSREPDELGLNYGTESMPMTIAGVKYEPAVVFREYPFSVIEKIDLSNIMITPKLVAGTVFAGPVFAINPNTPGRHIYEYATPLHPQPENFSAGTKATKHIDCVVIHNTDVVTSSLGRSDEDVFNIFQMYANSVNPTASYRDQLNNFCPLVNHISVMRHGLRVREVTTDFANYPNSEDTKDYKAPRRNLIRWQILFDHWYQHNPEYLTGSITMRGLPELRVGYRLDWYERNESFYVESVSHSWQYPQSLQTTAEVSRGQRNDPFPVYIPPVFLDGDETLQTSSGDRSRDGRLAQFFKIKDRDVTLRATDRGDTNRDEGPNVTDMRVGAQPGRVVFAYVDNDNKGAEAQPLPSTIIPGDTA